MTLEWLVAEFVRLVVGLMRRNWVMGPAKTALTHISHRYLRQWLHCAPLRWCLGYWVPLNCCLVWLKVVCLKTIWPWNWIGKSCGHRLVLGQIVRSIKGICPWTWIRHTGWSWLRYAIRVPGWRSHVHRVACVVKGRYLGIGTTVASTLGTKISALPIWVHRFSRFFFTLPFFIRLHSFMSFFRDPCPPEFLSSVFIWVKRGSGEVELFAAGCAKNEQHLLCIDVWDAKLLCSFDQRHFVTLN